MGGTCIEKLTCSECGKDNLQVFENEDDTYTGYCYNCDKYFHNPYSSSEQKEERKVIHMHERKEVDPSALPIKELSTRGIREEVCRLFDVHCELSESDGRTVTKSYYPDTKDGDQIGWEVRDHQSKRFHSLGDRKGSFDLWGTDLARKNNGNKLFITEGRLDAMSVYQCIIDNTVPKFKHLKPSVVSLTRGAGGAAKDIIANREFVESFKEVVLIFDNDEAGSKAIKEVLKTFPLFKVAKLPLKDANDMVMEGRNKELFNQIMWKADVLRQGEVVTIEDIIDTCLVKPKMGIDTPWPSVTKLCYGFRPHTIHIVGAAPKIGKSDHEYQILHHLVYNLKQKVGVFDLENPPSKTAKKIASKEDGIDYTRPTTMYEDERLRSVLLQQRDLVSFYDRGASREWSDIRVSMELLHQIDGVNFFILDPITALISRYSASEANDRLNEICTDMADFVHKFPVTLINYSHVNPKPKSSKSHEEGGRVLSSEFTGSRAMEKWFHYGWGIRRNRSPECPPEDQNVSHLDLLFDRDFGNSGSVPLFFNKDDMSYLEMAL